MWLPIADLAHRNGITSETIATASLLFQTIIENVERRLLEKYIEQYGSDATVAIVGNGPHELGTGNGSEIDAHDIVARFNNYNESPEFVRDYGSKTNIVLFTHGSSNAYKVIRKQADVLICGTLAEPCDLEYLSEYKKHPVSNITTFEYTPVRYESLIKYNISWPSAGFRMVYYLKEIKKAKLTPKDIYGMALRTGIIRSGHYENSSFQFDSVHNIEKELRAMQDIFNEDRSE
jgi:hypothetical protein